MSLPFCAALAWTTGGAALRAMHDFENPAVLALLPRVALIADPARGRYQPLLEVTLQDGRRLAWEEREGRDAYLLTGELAVRMARALYAEVGAGGADRLMAAIDALERAPSIAPVLDAAIAACAKARQAA
jgi:hypothetical protein